MASAVTLQVKGSTIEAVSAGGSRPEHATHLAGLTLPGFANTHSHAFHRALRGRAERARGSFWTWRDLMYSVADRLTPDRYFALARAVYAEMALAGFTVVGEFHYLHHASGGARYDDPNEMGRAVLAAGREAGVKVVLLDACYLEAGPGRALEGVQLRFGDGSVEAWAERAAKLAADMAGGPAAGPADSTGPVIGAAVHSMRAVPPAAAQRVAEWAAERASPLHFHCSEQPAENDAVLAAYGSTPVQLLARAGALRPGSIAVHATHLSDADARALGARAPEFACARRRNATWVTGSGRAAGCSGSVRQSRSAVTATPSSTLSRRCGRSSSTSGWHRYSVAILQPSSSSNRRPPPGTTPSATRREAVSAPAPRPTS